MSERPATDPDKKDAQGGSGTDETQKPPDMPKAPEKPRAPAKPSWTGSATYPDGFTLDRDASGTVTLTAPDGVSATWSYTDHTWVSAGGAPMPADWSGGHMPADYGSGPGTPQAH